MTDTKSLLKSKTFIGIFVTVIAIVADKFLGLEFDTIMQADISSNISLIVEAAGLLFATYGRAVATKKIG